MWGYANLITGTRLHQLNVRKIVKKCNVARDGIYSKLTLRTQPEDKGGYCKSMIHSCFYSNMCIDLCSFINVPRLSP